MKKILCLVISLIVLLSSVSAFAEEFTVHSGVTFGMSKDEVIACENEAGFSSQTAKRNAAFCNDMKHHTDVLQLSGKIAGQDGAMILYHFNSADEMEAAVYWFGGEASTIKEALIDKYGESDSEFTLIAASKLETEAYSFYTDGLSMEELGLTTANLFDECSWRVDQEDGSSVVISYVYSVVSGFPFSSVSYQLFSTEELDNYHSELISEYNESQQQLDDDL